MNAIEPGIPFSRRRLFLVDFDLTHFQGHYFNQLFGFRSAAAALGLEPRVFIPEKAEGDIIAALDAEAVLPEIAPYETDRGAALKAFDKADVALRALWKALEKQTIGRHDLLLITSARPAVMSALGAWLDGLASESRPAVFIRAFGTDFLTPANTEYSDRAWAFGHAAATLRTRRGQERVFLTINNRAQIQKLESLALRRAFFMPPPKYYGDARQPRRLDYAGSIRIYAHCNRPDDLPAQVAAAAKSVSRLHPDVRFEVRIYRHASETGAEHDAVRQNLAASGLDVLPADEDQDRFLAAIERSQIVFLPYHPVEYRGIVSGPFCEAAALGKVIVVPDGTWMAAQIREGHAAGVVFFERTAADMAAAIEQAVNDLPRLQAMAMQLADEFRAENSCRRNIELMLALSRQTHDMQMPETSLMSTLPASMPL